MRAAEDLLARYRPEQVSMERIAAAAGVGKGTLFHRFGSRMGLMTALMEERALALRDQVETGPPPLGPGAPPRERLLAFLDAVCDVVARNKGLLAALGHAAGTHRPQRPEGEPDHPVYDAWHGHVSALIERERPDLDAPMVAHMLLAAFASPYLMGSLERGESERVAVTLRRLAVAVLDAAP
ncbi:TetR/AcrR family transcriptional regulator [Streptomyces sp. SID5468]|uniref:TetR/AcrR family transcriptional regulator n=1 Tax=Streptomyces sp. SID5468 TaxID=2690295 RepID=UPI001928E452|nr:TetR/AcrR family transcriptional regulator [Streptomyces sp. SID5468]